MKSEYLTFDDVLIKPTFSEVASRKLVDLSTSLTNGNITVNLKLPILSANMDTITGSEMAIAMANAGGLGVLHRFWSIEDNLTAFNKVLAEGLTCAGSVGLGDYEFKRAISLFEAGCEVLVLDVAHGAQMAVVAQYKRLKEVLRDSIIVVGNFATIDSIRTFCFHLNGKPDAIKVGIGPGSACTTRIKTGVGMPQLTAILECVKAGIPVIADGGMRSSGDIAKALAVGAKAVMLGGMLSGTIETNGDIIYPEGEKVCPVKVYRGSASKESYCDQNKDWACAEGETFIVPYKGPVAQVLADIEGGLKSSFSYVNSNNLTSFQNNAKLVVVSNNTILENKAHGKIN